MSFRTRVTAVICAAAAVAGSSSLARAGMIASQTSTLPLTMTNFNTDGSGISPLTFNQFDTKNNTLQLDEVDLTFHALVKNQFGMTFTTPATITATIGGSNPTSSGPVITMYQPDGKTPLVSATASSTASLSRSVTWGYNAGEALPQKFGSDQPVGSPFYLQPTIAQATSALKLTAPSDLSLFTGSGTVKLPVVANAFSTFHTSSGNGTGWVTTYGSADATVTYKYHERVPAPEVVPEPATVLLWGVSGIAILAVGRYRKRV